MWRYFVGVAAGVLLVVGGLLVWQNTAAAHHAVPLPPLHLTGPATADEGGEVPDPPAASEKTREEKRFSRYDHDKDGKVSRDEFLVARRRAFAKLDTNGDGQLSFDEYAVKGAQRFAAADADRSGALTPAEFTATKIVHKTKTAPRCPPASAERGDDEG